MESPAAPNPLKSPAAQGIAALVLVLGGMWVAQQGGFTFEHASQFVSCIYVPVMAARLLVPLWVGAAGLGWLARLILLRHARPALLIQMGTGLGLLLLSFWALGLGGWLNAATVWGVCGVGAALLIHQALQPPYRRVLIEQEFPSPSWLVLLACPILGLMLVACICPPHSLWRIEAYGYDVLSYHLELPREWLATGRIAGLHHNVYSYLPNLVEAGYMGLGAMAGSMRDAVYVAPMFHVTAAVLAAAAVGGWVSRALGGTGLPPGVLSLSTPGTSTTAVETAQKGGATADTAWKGGATESRRAMAAAFAGVLLLVLPWTMVTGTLAYDEMFAMALGCTAMVVAFDAAGQTLGGAALAGFLAGAATLAKLPFGPMLALPVGLVYLLGWGEQRHDGAASVPAESKASVPKRGRKGTKSGRSTPPPADHTRPGGRVAASTFRRRLTLASIAALAGLLTLAPYFVRNALWTGNPVFPFAANSLGKDYWSEYDVMRWNRGHGLSGESDHHLWNLGRHWLFNTGYGALGSLAHPAMSADEARHNIAHFTEEWGFPLFWLLAAAGAVVGLIRTPTRRAAAALLLTLGVQLAFWLGATHMQSRFLIPSLLPGCGLVGLLLGSVLARPEPQRGPPVAQWAAMAAGVVVLMVFTVNSYHVFYTQTLAGLKPWQITDALLPPADLDKLGPEANAFGNHRLNQLSPQSLTYLVADNADLFYIRRPFLYDSAFDPCLLGGLIRQFQGRGEAAGVTGALRTRGITNIWVNWSELRRLHETYGFDPDVTVESINRLARDGGWTVVDAKAGWYTLYELP